MNIQKLIAALVSAGIALAPFLPTVWQGIIGTVAGVIGTFVVRPSQVSAKLGQAVNIVTMSPATSSSSSSSAGAKATATADADADGSHA